MKDSQGILLTTAVFVGAAILYFFWRRKEEKQKWKEVAMVDKLLIHPVKACRGLLVENFIVREKGVIMNDSDIGDRSFMMVYEDGLFTSLKIFPKMALIRPSVIGGKHLRLEAPGMNPIEIDIRDYGIGKIVSHKVYGALCPGVDCGDEVAAWLHKFLGIQNTRLMFHDERLAPKKRDTYMEYGHLGLYSKEPLKSRFHNASAINMVSQASIDFLNAKLDSDHQVTERFFRPNVLLTGCEAFAEDKWKRFRIGSCEFVFAKHAHRCPTTTVNPETGIMDPAKSTLTALSTFRLGTPEEKPVYGISPKFSVDYVVIKEGKINVGDKVLLYTGDKND